MIRGLLWASVLQMCKPLPLWTNGAFTRDRNHGGWEMDALRRWDVRGSDGNLWLLPEFAELTTFTDVTYSAISAQRVWASTTSTPVVNYCAIFWPLTEAVFFLFLLTEKLDLFTPSELQGGGRGGWKYKVQVRATKALWLRLQRDFCQMLVNVVSSVF